MEKQVSFLTLVLFIFWWLVIFSRTTCPRSDRLIEPGVSDRDFLLLIRDSTNLDHQTPVKVFAGGEDKLMHILCVKS